MFPYRSWRFARRTEEGYGSLDMMTKSRLSAVQENRRLAIILGIAGLIAALLVVKPKYMDPTAYHFWLEACGCVCMILAIFVRLWCTLYIGGRKGSSLMTDGPYSISRNPLYVGSVIGAAGLGLQTGMLTFAVLCGALCWIIFSVVVRREERFLQDRFGQAYSAYRATTPRFLPDFRKYDEGTVRYEFDPQALWRTLRDGLLFLIAIPITEIIEILHESGNLPDLLTAF